MPVPHRGRKVSELTTEPPQSRKADLFTGLLLTGLLLLAGAGWAYSRLSSTESAETYYFYVSNIGGMKPGDPVRLRGRRIGRVTATEILAADAGLRVRVEFAIFRKFKGRYRFPTDSRAVVIGRGAFSRAGVVIEYGTGSAEMIELGAEWANPVPVVETDAVSEIAAKLDSANESIRDFNAFLESGDALDLAREVAHSVEASMLKLDAMMAEAMSSAGEFAASFQNGGKDMAQLRLDLAAKREAITDAVSQFEQSLAGTGEETARALERVQTMSKNFAEISAEVAEAEQSSADPELREAFRRLRLQSAEAAASLRLAWRDPSAIGDPAARLRVAGRFNGGRTALGPLHKNELEEESSKEK